MKSVASAALVREVEDLAIERMVALGFKKRARGFFTWDVDSAESVEGLVGLNRAVHKRGGDLEVNPVVGIRNQAIERLVAELKGEKLHPYISATVAVHLGYLMPQRSYVPWRFSEGGPNDQTAEAMARAIDQYGKPFAAANRDLKELQLAIEQRDDAASRAFRLPVALLLLGRPGEAREVVHKEVAALAGRSDPGERKYRDFANRFLELTRDTAEVR